MSNTKSISNKGTIAYSQQLQTSLVPSHNNGTWHVGMMAECPYSAVRAVIRNQESTSYTLNALAFASSNDITSSIPTGFWTIGTFASANSVVVPARLAVNRPSTVYSDWMNVQSLLAIDGSGLYPIHARAYIATGPFSYGGGSVTLSQYSKASANSLVNKRYVNCAVAAGDFVSTNQSGFVASPTSLSPLLELEFLTSQQILNVSWVGDSIGFGGGGTMDMMGAGRLACNSVSNLAAPIFYQNACVPSTTTTQFVVRLKDMLTAGSRPNVLIYSAFSPNDGTPTDMSIGVNRYNLSIVLNLCEQYNIIPIVDTGCPNTLLAWNSTADNIRKAWVNEIRNLKSQGIMVLDSDSALSDQATPARYLLNSTTDNTHPNDVGQASIAAKLTPLLQSAIDILSKQRTST